MSGKRFVCCYILCMVLSFTGLRAQDMMQPHWVTGVRDTLPEWMGMAQENGMLIAASDPCLDLDTGRKQAIRRALWLFTLQNRMRISVLSDVFSKVDSSSHRESGSGKMLSLMRLDHLPQAYMYRVVNEHQTLFGEVILQLEVKPVGDALQDYSKFPFFKSQSEWMIVYSDDKFKRKEYKILLRIPAGNGQVDCFEMKGTLEHPVISSTFRGDKYYLSQKGCWYADMPVQPAVGGEGSDMQYSFWVAYISALADQLLAASFSESEIKSVADSYQNSLMLELSREKSITYVRIVPQIKGVKGNRLFVRWDIKSDLELTNH